MSAAERVASMSPDELIAVIERGLEADEQAARAWLPFGNPSGAQRNHIARHDPGWVLADVESKREILARYDVRHSDDFIWQPILAALARPYLAQETA